MSGETSRIELMDGAEEQKQVDKLFDDIRAGKDDDFASDFAKIAWEDRAKVAGDLQSKLDMNRSTSPTLPELQISYGKYKDSNDQEKPFVDQIKAIEERSKYDPRTWFGYNRTNPYQVYSPGWLEKKEHKILEVVRLAP
jgi:hypothetical protein